MIELNRAALIDLLRTQMNEIYFIENQLVTALGMNARAAVDPELKETFLSHRDETIQHVHRAEAIFKELGVLPGLFPSQAITGALDDAKWMMLQLKEDPSLDATMIIAAQKLENLEISCYQAVLALSKQLEMQRVVDTCEIILEEEKSAKRKLRSILARLIGGGSAHDHKTTPDITATTNQRHSSKG